MLKGLETLLQQRGEALCPKDACWLLFYTQMLGYIIDMTNGPQYGSGNEMFHAPSEPHN